MRDRILWLLLGVLFVLMLDLIIFGADQLKENKVCLSCANEDVNRDGKVDTKDLLQVQKYIKCELEK